MSIPPGVNEADFIGITTLVAKSLYKKFGAIHGTLDDFSQQVVVWALEALPKYDSSRALDCFIFTVAKSRAMNAIRDKVTRNDPPCRLCHTGTPCGASGECCRKYNAWATRNRAKANLARPLGLTEVSDTHEALMRSDSDVESGAAARELAELIDRHLPVGLRADYLRLLAGEQVPKPRRVRVQEAVADIIENPGRYEAEQVNRSERSLDAEDLFDEDDEQEVDEVAA